MKSRAKAPPPGGVRRIIARIEGIGGLADQQELEFRSGTTNRVAGANAVGKTTAAQAIAFALGDETEVPDINDGAEIGTVEVQEVGEDGAQVSKVQAVVPSRGRVRRKGEPSIETSERAVRALDILLTGDHAKSAETRNKARITAFLSIVKPALDDAAAKLLCEGDGEYGSWLLGLVESGQVTDLLAGAKELQARLQREAREHEASAESWGGRAAGAADQVAARLSASSAVVVAEPDVDGARARLGALQITLAEVRRDAAARVEKESLQWRIRASATPRPDPAPHEAEARAAVAVRDAARAEQHQIAEEIARLQERHQAAVLRESDAVETGRAAEARWREAHRAAEAWDAQQALLEEVVAGPGEAELQAAMLAVEEASDLLRHHEVSAEVLALQAAENDAKLQADRAARRAKELRAWNAAVPERVADVLARSGGMGFTIVDGFLAFRGAGGEPRDFDSRLSPGEKVKAAFPLVAQALGGWALISGEIYRAWLDDAGRLAVEGWANDHPEVFVVTEEPTSRGLHVEYGPFVQEGGA